MKKQTAVRTVSIVLKVLSLISLVCLAVVLYAALNNIGDAVRLADSAAVKSLAVITVCLCAASCIAKKVSQLFC